MDHILGAHFAENFCESLIAIDRDVVLNVAGVNLADVFEDDADFLIFWFTELKCVTMLDGISISNGIGWSLDGRFFFHTDSLDHSIYRYTIQGQQLSNKEVFYTPPIGTPDGLTIDSDGNLWIAIWDGGRVVQLSHEGKELAQILLPVTRPTSVTFGGPDLRTLYITSASVDLPEDEKSAQPYAGALFSMRMDVVGLPANRFILRANPINK